MSTRNFFLELLIIAWFFRRICFN